MVHILYCSSYFVMIKLALARMGSSAIKSHSIYCPMTVSNVYMASIGLLSLYLKTSSFHLFVNVVHMILLNDFMKDLYLPSCMIQNLSAYYQYLILIGHNS